MGDLIHIISFVYKKKAMHQASPFSYMNVSRETSELAEFRDQQSHSLE